jgi:hypothetical protein
MVKKIKIRFSLARNPPSPLPRIAPSRPRFPSATVDQHAMEKLECPETVSSKQKTKSRLFIALAVGLVFLRLSGWKNSRSPQLTGNVDEREDWRRRGHGFAPTGCAVRMPSSCSSSSRPLRGRFARLDASARRWRLAGHVVLVTEAAPKGRFRAPKQHECHLPRRRDAVTPKGPKRSGGSAQPIDGGSAAWPSLAARLNQTAVID